MELGAEFAARLTATVRVRVCYDRSRYRYGWALPEAPTLTLGPRGRAVALALEAIRAERQELPVPMGNLTPLLIERTGLSPSAVRNGIAELERLHLVVSVGLRKAEGLGQGKRLSILWPPSGVPIEPWRGLAERDVRAADEAADAARVRRVAALRRLPYAEYLRTDHWRWQRARALRRAGGRCQACNTTESLNVHHRTYERLGDEAYDDLTVLCRTCHELFHANGKLARR